MNRRTALQAAAAICGVPFAHVAASAAAATANGSSSRPKSWKIDPVALPSDSLYEKDPEKYWAAIREDQFFLPKWRTFLNNGSLGIAPKPVFRAVADYLAEGAALLVEGYPRWGYETMEPHREEIAAFIGCKKDELALMHSATESMSTVAAGLDLKQGDEVIITDQEHPSGRGCWQMRAARGGIEVREVKIPVAPKNLSEITDILISAIGPRTRVLSFSSVLTTTGLVMPAKEICHAARAKGVITLVDGAHHHGQVPLNIHDMGCDFMAGSPHKWMFAPAGCGLLYIREEWLEKLWPTVVSGSWNDHKLKAARFMNIGTNNRAIMEGLVAGLRFGKSIGYERVYSRIHQLAKTVCERARKVPYMEVVTPDDDRTYGSLAFLRFKKDPKPLWALCDKRKIWITHGDTGMRFSTHIHTRPRDIDIFFETVNEALGS